MSKWPAGLSTHHFICSTYANNDFTHQYRIQTYTCAVLHCSALTMRKHFSKAPGIEQTDILWMELRHGLIWYICYWFDSFYAHSSPPSWRLVDSLLWFHGLQTSIGHTPTSTKTVEVLRNGQILVWLRYLNSKSVTSVISKINTECSLCDFVPIAIVIIEIG